MTPLMAEMIVQRVVRISMIVVIMATPSKR